MEHSMCGNKSAALALALLALTAAPAAAQMYEKMAVVRYQANGALDPSFDADGSVITDIAGSDRDTFYSVVPATVTMANDRVLAGGVRHLPVGDNNGVLVRYIASSGALDTSFGVGGLAILDLVSYTSEVIIDVAIDSMGRIVVAGTADSPRKMAMVARFRANGTIDTTFGANGYVFWNSTATSQDLVRAVVIDGMGRIVVGGYRLEGSVYTFQVARLTATGAFDTTFGGGRVFTPFPGASSTEIADVAVDTSNRPIAVGIAAVGTGYQSAIARYTVNGAPDTSFSGDGLLQLTFSGYPNATAKDVIIDLSGNITVAHTTFDDAQNSTAIGLSRLLPSGAFDNSFDADGRLVTSFGPSLQARAPRVLFPLNMFAPAMIVVGYATVTAAPGQARMIAAGYNPNGSLVTTYGSAGKVTTQIGTNGINILFDAITTGDGKITGVGAVQ